MTNYYEEIRKKIGNVPDYIGMPLKNWIKRTQEYCYYYAINREAKDVLSIIQNYMDEEDYLTTATLEEERKRSKSLYFVSKLYIEFIWKIYKKCYEQLYQEDTEKMFFEEIIYSDDLMNVVSKTLDTYKKGLSEKYAYRIAKSIDDWKLHFDNHKRIEQLSLENLHKAMDVLEQAFSKPMPTEKDSVGDVVEKDILDKMFALLKGGEYPACLFLIVAPMTRALTSGTIHKYTPGNSTVYFSKNFEYNMEQLKTRIDAMREIFDMYYEERYLIKEELKTV